MKEFDTVSLKKILIIMMGGIGNMIFLTPALKALKEKFIDTKIIFLIGSYHAEAVLKYGGLMDGYIVADSKDYNGIYGKIKLIKKIKNEKFDLAISSTGTNALKSGLIMFLANIPQRLGENIYNKGFFYNIKIPFDTKSHEVDQNIKLVERLGIVVKNKNMFFSLSDEAMIFAKNFIANSKFENKIIGFHPGSGIHQAYFKRWAKEKYATLGDLLIKKDKCDVILFGGPKEIKLGEDIQKLMKYDAINVIGKHSLHETAALISKCNLFVSNDSGLMNVACSLGVPVLSIIGPTDFNKTAPYSKKGFFIRKELDCSPCYEGKNIHCDHMTCLNSITTKEVYDKVISILKKYYSDE